MSKLAEPDKLERFLSDYKPLVEERVEWGRPADRPLPLRISACLTEEQPPLEYVTSVRSVVLRGDEVLVMRNSDGMHVLPGGRRERGETVEETLRREVFEEAGWTLRDISPLGFAHLHHLADRPPGYGYPYPDFMWMVFVAAADEFTPDAEDPDGYEIESEFVPFDEATALDFGAVNHLFLSAAVFRLR